MDDAVVWEFTRLRVRNDRSGKRIGVDGQYSRLCSCGSRLISVYGLSIVLLLWQWSFVVEASSVCLAGLAI